MTRNRVRCKVCNSKREIELHFYGFPICGVCWENHTSNKIDLKKALNIKEESPDRGNLSTYI